MEDLICQPDANTEVVLLGDFLQELMWPVRLRFLKISHPKGSKEEFFRERLWHI